MPASPRAFPQTATIERYGPGGTDEYGNEVRELVSTEDVACNLQPQWSRELTANQDTQLESFNLYLPAGVSVAGTDRVVVDGVVLEVYGPGGEWVDFDRVPHHTEVTLRKVV